VVVNQVSSIVPPDEVPVQEQGGGPTPHNMNMAYSRHTMGGQTGSGHSMHHPTEHAMHGMGTTHEPTDIGMNMGMEMGMGAMSMGMNMDSVNKEAVSFNVVAGLDDEIGEALFELDGLNITCAHDFDCSSVWMNEVEAGCAPLSSPQSFCQQAQSWLICLRSSSPPSIPSVSDCLWPLTSIDQTISFLQTLCVSEAECIGDACGVCGGFIQDVLTCPEVVASPVPEASSTPSSSPLPSTSNSGSDTKSMKNSPTLFAATAGISLAAGAAMVFYFAFSRLRRNRHRPLVTCQPIVLDNASMVTVHAI
jgi:hypothetical protein